MKNEENTIKEKYLHNIFTYTEKEEKKNLIIYHSTYQHKFNFKLLI